MASSTDVAAEIQALAKTVQTFQNDLSSVISRIDDLTKVAKQQPSNAASTEIQALAKTLQTSQEKLSPVVSRIEDLKQIQEQQTQQHQKEQKEAQTIAASCSCVL